MVYMTTGEAARMLGVGLNTVKRWISGGVLRGVCTPGGHWRIPKEDLYAFMQANGMPILRENKRDPARVLIVDDDVSVCALHQAILEHADFMTEIQCANDGYTGLIKIGAWRPDILVLDILMPGINGIEVLRRIKADDDHHDMAIIVVSGAYDQPNVVQAAKAAGVTAILPKPVEAHRFRDVVGTCLALMGSHNKQQARSGDERRRND